MAFTMVSCGCGGGDHAWWRRAIFCLGRPGQHWFGVRGDGPAASTRHSCAGQHGAHPDSGPDHQSLTGGQVAR